MYSLGTETPGPLAVSSPTATVGAGSMYVMKEAPAMSLLRHRPMCDKPDRAGRKGGGGKTRKKAGPLSPSVSSFFLLSYSSSCMKPAFGSVRSLQGPVSFAIKVEKKKKPQTRTS